MPHEPTADRAHYLNRVADGDGVHKVRGYGAASEQFDRQFDARTVGRVPDRERASGRRTVGRRWTNDDMLARDMTRPVRNIEHERARRRRFASAFDNLRGAPGRLVRRRCR
jgi:hypothetical protein